jgi:acyl-CoA thioester hydrolase
MAHVNHSFLFLLRVVIRLEWMLSLGERLDGRTVEGLIIVNAFCTFHKQFEYPGDILAKLYVSDPGRTSFESWTTMTRAEEPDAVYASGGSTIVWVDYTKQKSVPLPERIRAIVG